MSGRRSAIAPRNGEQPFLDTLCLEAAFQAWFKGFERSGDRFCVPAGVLCATRKQAAARGVGDSVSSNMDRRNTV